MREERGVGKCFCDFWNFKKTHAVQYRYSNIVHFFNQTHIFYVFVHLFLSIAEITKFALMRIDSHSFNPSDPKGKSLEYITLSSSRLRPYRNQPSIPLLAISADVRVDCRLRRVLPGSAEFYDVANIRKVSVLDGGDRLGIFGILRRLRRF